MKKNLITRNHDLDLTCRSFSIVTAFVCGLVLLSSPEVKGNMAVLDLVPLSEATNIVVESGNWSNPDTWAKGELPQEGARIVVPQGMTLLVDSELSPRFKTIRVDGTLDFDTSQDTQLRVDTLVTTMTGSLVIGSVSSPLEAGVTAKIMIADDGPIDLDWDPTIISRGALLMGSTRMHGAEKTAFAPLAQAATIGDNALTLAFEPTGWMVGDEISIAGVEPGNPLSDEVLTITAINGSTLSFAPALQRDHTAPRIDLDVHVANLTRNIQFRSENTAAQHRGHVMFMHTNDVDVRFVSFQGLGRTDKSIDLEDWFLISGTEESLCPDTTIVEEIGGFNVRGRYSVHFHRGGPSGSPALVEGSVVRDDVGWGYVNHSSNVDFIENVSHNVTGAAYNTEAGDEIGSFIGNIAIRTYNPNANLNPPEEEVDPEQEPDARAQTQDYGWQGDGFWFHGAGVAVDDNVVAGASGHGFIYWTLGLVERGLGENQVDVANLPNGDLIGPPGTKVRTKHVPVPSFDGNVVYGATKGLQIHYLHTDNRDDLDEEFESIGKLAIVPQYYENQLQSTFSNFTVWNATLSAIAAPYCGRLTFAGLDLQGLGDERSIGIMADHFANQNNITIIDATLDGFQIGITAPRQGLGVIEDVQVSAVTDIRINVPVTDARNLEILDIEFLPLSDLFEPGQDRINIDLDPAHGLDFGGGLFDLENGEFKDEELFDVPPIFQKDRIVFDNPGYENVGLYFGYDAQSADFVPIPKGSELSGFVESELIGLTNEELQEQFGFSFSDAMLPADAQEDPMVPNGLVGSALPPYCSFPILDDTYWVEFLDFDLRGDVNEDGVVNLLDVGPFVDQLANGEYSINADVNGDDALNLLDVEPFICALTGQ